MVYKRVGASARREEREVHSRAERFERGERLTGGNAVRGSKRLCEHGYGFQARRVR